MFLVPEIFFMVRTKTPLKTFIEAFGTYKMLAEFQDLINKIIPKTDRSRICWGELGIKVGEICFSQVKPP